MKTDEKIVSKYYDKWADSYHNMRTKENPDGWFFNELLEMPTMLEILGNVRGKNILDFGCGTGIYAKLLTQKGAKVKGFDINKEMIKIAKKENPNLDLRVGSGYKIPFREKFDIVMAPLVVHYIKDWDKMFREIRRVLKDEGYFIFSTNNPVSESSEGAKRKGKKVKILTDYFTEKKLTTKIPSYHLTYETIIKTILKNGFEIVDYKDAFPLKKAKKLFPDYYERYSKIPFFMVWKVMKK